jgi:hypothetical protein
MIRRLASRYAYRAAVVTLSIAICLVGGFLLMVAMPDLTGIRAEQPSASPAAATPSPSAGTTMAMGRVTIPATADCSACHLTAGGAIGLKPIPVMAHPVQGFTDCTACHNPDGLVKTAPGHSGIHKDDCLVCHKPPTGTAGTASVGPMRPEHMGMTQPCTACHGVDQHAPMPADMVGRGDNCWICHNGPEFTYLFATPVPSVSAEPTASPR